MKRATFIITLLALAACNSESDGTTAPLADASLSRSGADDHGNNGFVYTLSNQAAGNAVLVFKRSHDGTLSAAGEVATGGNGSGAGLGSQNALALSADGELLFAVNAGSNTVSSFRVSGQGLTLVDTHASGGTHPISLTASHGLLYVLNDGGDGNIAGLRYDSRGRLWTIAGSTRALSSSGSAPAQIEFTPTGDRLIVTEKGTNMIGAYNVGASGLASAGTFTVSSGATPFGFTFARNTLVVTEAFGGAPGASAASSYSTAGTGAVSLISGSVPTTQTAACWFVATNNGKYAFATNTGSGTVTAYGVTNRGALTRLTGNGVSADVGAGSAPADAALSRNSQFLYTRNGGNRTISAIRVNADGSLDVLSGGGISGLPAGAVGLAAK